MKDPEVHNESEWQQEAPLLASLPRKKESPAPEGYFDGLPARVMEQIRAGEAAAPEAAAHAPARFPWKSLLTIAASLALVFLLADYWLPGAPEAPAASTPRFADAARITEQLDLFSLTDEEIAGNFSDADFDALRLQEDLNPLSQEGLANELMSHEITPDDLGDALTGTAAPATEDPAEWLENALEGLDPDAIQPEDIDLSVF